MAMKNTEKEPEMLCESITGKGCGLKKIIGIIRHLYDEMPVRVEYTLTEKAKTLIPILLELKQWGEANL